MTIRSTVRRWSIGAVAFTATAGLAVGMAPASQAHDDHWYEPLVTSYDDPGPPDNGGYDASVRLLAEGEGSGHYTVEFQAYDELLKLYDDHSDGRQACAQVKVYRHADSDGVPYDEIDSDRFCTGTDRTYELGTPDGSGNIREGRWVAIRVAPWGTTLSPWAYARA